MKPGDLLELMPGIGSAHVLDGDGNSMGFLREKGFLREENGIILTCLDLDDEEFAYGDVMWCVKVLLPSGRVGYIEKEYLRVVR